MINKQYFIYIFTILLLSSNTVLAEVKIGIVKLDILFKEIPIYKESQNQMKNEFKPKADELKKIETSWNELNDDYLKSWMKKSCFTQDDLSEIRLLYVSVTRAIKNLNLSKELTNFKFFKNPFNNNQQASEKRPTIPSFLREA